MQQIEPDALPSELSRLIGDVARGDKAAFSRLFEHFAPRIKAMMMRGGLTASAADDFAQEAMLTVWRKAHLFDPDSGGASAWIYAIARNRRIDVARSDQRFPTSSGAAVPETIDDQPLPDAAVNAQQEEEKVRAALERLSADQKRVLHLAFFEGQSHSEVAETLNIPLGTVKSRTRLAFQRLRELLGNLE